MLNLEDNTYKIRTICFNCTPSFPDDILRKSPIIFCTSDTLISNINPHTFQIPFINLGYFPIFSKIKKERFELILILTYYKIPILSLKNINFIRLLNRRRTFHLNNHHVPIYLFSSKKIVFCRCISKLYSINCQSFNAFRIP